MTKQEFKKLTQEKYMILDGATGSNLIQAGMPRGVCVEKWITENPDILQNLQKAYIEAGSDIIYAPTFAANRISLAAHGLAEQTEILNKTLVSISQEAAGSRAYIAGDITTTGKMVEPLGDMTYEELFEAYKEQITYLEQAGVDLLVAETMIGTDETMAVLDAAASVCHLPVMCSLTTESDGSLFTGGNVFDAALSLAELGADAVGINCSCGPDQLESVIRKLCSLVDIPVIAKPNAGLPEISSDGMALYSMGAEEFVSHMEKLQKAGARLLGGCCGTTPEYIRLLKKRVDEIN